MILIRNPPIYHLLEDGLINARHLLNVAKISRSVSKRHFKDCKITDTKILRGHCSTQGTYISYQDALKLCIHLKFEQSLIHEVIGSINKITGEATEKMVDIYIEKKVEWGSSIMKEAESSLPKRLCVSGKDDEKIYRYTQDYAEEGNNTKLQLWNTKYVS